MCSCAFRDAATQLCAEAAARQLAERSTQWKWGATSIRTPSAAAAAVTAAALYLTLP